MACRAVPFLPLPRVETGIFCVNTRKAPKESGSAILVNQALKCG